MPVDQLPARSELQKAADCLRTLGHPARLEICLLIDAGQYNVGQIAELCGVPSHVASEHLRLMERCGLLHRTRLGRESFYQIAEPSLRDILNCIGNRLGPSKRRRKKR